MSWKLCKIEKVEGVRKCKWDGLWHVLYDYNGQQTYDRVDKRTAMNVLKKINKARQRKNYEQED